MNSTLQRAIRALFCAGVIASAFGGEVHWSLRPLVRPEVPAVNAPVENPIDAFIISELEHEGLSGSQAKEADRRTLIRRAFFVITGLPPTPEQINQFVHENGDAYERLVDRLLDSPAYGERWARHWLDIVHFAESNGFETNLERKNAWPYRDYVIEAFNSDKPYDQFIREQLAGDAFGADPATGFLVAGAWDAVKSPDVNLTAQQRMDELNDMIATTSSVFVGMTVGCARCHDHKFDPIKQTDYYAMQAIFAGVQHGERAIREPDEAARASKLEQARADRLKAEKRISVLDPLYGIDLEHLGEPSASANEEEFPPVQAKFLKFVIEATAGNAEPCLDELEVFTTNNAEGNVALASKGTHASSSGDFAGNPKHMLAHLNDGIYGNDHSWISARSGKGWVQLEFPEVVSINRVVWSRDREKQFKDRIPSGYNIEAGTSTNDWRTVASSRDRQERAKARALAEHPARALTPAEKTEAERLRVHIKKLRDEEARLSSHRMAYAGKFEQPGPTYRLYRGEALQKRERVAPGAISGVGSTLSLDEDAPEQSRRIALANWITDPRNPLTARVIVNRLWQYDFGEGIVSTPSDFGRNGALPSHPELLDWLASELIDSGWHLKHVQRLILTSKTFRQSSHALPDALAKDAGDRLLWRFPPQRLEAEEVRDSILAVSGKLDRRMGGPGFDLFMPNGNYVKVYTSKQKFGPEEFRRMIYQEKPRMQLDDTFGAFDCPDAGQVAPKRNVSTTPLQALNLLNSTFIVQQADFLAERLEKEAGADDSRVDARVARAFELAFGRQASGDEIRRGVALAKAEGLPILCRALFNANEFLYVF